MDDEYAFQDSRAVSFVYKAATPRLGELVLPDDGWHHVPISDKVVYLDAVLLGSTPSRVFRGVGKIDNLRYHDKELVCRCGSI